MQWQKMLTENITSMEALKEKMGLSKEELQDYEKILERFPMTITPYYLSLIDWSDPKDPIRMMCIPTKNELDMTGDFDTSGEGENTVLPGMQHKYKQTALILSTHRCSMYCRHCFRKRLVGISDDETAQNFEEMAAYIQDHEEITNVLITGGDAFLNNNSVLENYLKKLSVIDHLDFIRFGTRVPVVFPARIYEDPQLLELLETYNRKKQIYVVTQFNHANEVTEEAKRAIDCLLRAGIVVRNQTVLLKGVNDDGKTMGTLLRRLTAIGVMPYYIFQCRPVSGVGTHFQVPLERGIQIIEEARQLSNGFGKGIRYAMSHYTGKVEILGMTEGKVVFKYHQAKDPQNYDRIFTKKLRENQAWLDDLT